MRLFIFFLFAAVLNGCKVVFIEKTVPLNARSKELFCAGARNMIDYVHRNDKLPHYSDSSLTILPEDIILYGVPPEFKSKLLNQEMVLGKRRDQRKVFPMACASELALKGYDLSRYYYDYDSAAKIIALVVVRTNEQYQRDEWIYFYGLLNDKGEIMKQDEFHYVEPKKRKQS